MTVRTRWLVGAVALALALVVALITATRPPKADSPETLFDRKAPPDEEARHQRLDELPRRD